VRQEELEIRFGKSPKPGEKKVYKSGRERREDVLIGSLSLNTPSGKSQSVSHGTLGVSVCVISRQKEREHKG